MDYRTNGDSREHPFITEVDFGPKLVLSGISAIPQETTFRLESIRLKDSHYQISHVALGSILRLVTKSRCKSRTLFFNLYLNL